MAFLLNSQAQGVSGKMNNLHKLHARGPQRRGAQCSCIDCIGLRPALASILVCSDEKRCSIYNDISAFPHCFLYKI